MMFKWFVLIVDPGQCTGVDIGEGQTEQDVWGGKVKVTGNCGIPEILNGWRK